MACLLVSKSKNYSLESNLVELCRDGNLKAVKSLLLNHPDIKITTISNAFFEACTNGHLKVAKIIMMRLHDLIDTYKLLDILSQGFYKACNNSHFKVAKWLHLILSKEGIFRYDVFIEACEKDNLKLAKWLYSSVGVVGKNVLPIGISKACEKGNLKVAKWLFKISGSKDNVPIFFDGIAEALKMGNLQLVKWFVSKFDITFKPDFFETVIITFQNGHKELLEWFLSIKHNYVMDFFNFLCEKGHLEIAQWFFFIYKDVIIFRGVFGAFVSACENDHLEIAQWLSTIGPNIVNSHDSIWFFIMLRCTIEIAKWLFSLKTDIDIFSYEDYFFKLSCERNNLEIARWLCSLNNRYKLTVRNEEIIAWKILKAIKTVKIIEVEEKKECCVCYEISDIQTKCGHYGCQSCFTQIDNKCPYCRSQIVEYYKIKKIN